MKRLYVRAILTILIVITSSIFTMKWAVHSLLMLDEQPIFGLVRPQIAAQITTLDALLQEQSTDARIEETMDAPMESVSDYTPPESSIHITAPSGRRFTISTHGDGLDAFTVSFQRGEEVRVIGPLCGSGVKGSWALVIGLTLLVLMVLLLGMVLTYPIARGLNRLRIVANKISAGDLSTRAEKNPNAPTAEVAQAFNVMAERIERLVEGQNILLAAVSHELRTPTSRIRFHLEMLEMAKDDHARSERIEVIDEDLNELDELVGELLTYSRVTTSRQVERAEIPLENALTRLLAAVCEQCSHIRFDLETTPEEPPVFVDADPHTFNRAMRNVLLNACHYARERVIVRWEQRPDGVCIIVDDDGPGIPPSERENIFAPFYRADQSRSRHSGGVGMGLAIVYHIIESHGGSIRVSDAELGGASFISWWPANVS